MQQKNQLRKKYFSLRKKKYYEINKTFFLPLLKLIKSRQKKKFIRLALYYPSNFEINVLKILEFDSISTQDILFPVIDKKKFMKFFSWKKNEILFVNKFGMLEPAKSKAKLPDIMLVPLLAFDKNKYRLGYGKGFYDRYLNTYLKQFKHILTVGVAFSFQKYHKLPISRNDVKLDFIITEKGIIK
jgi:5-formyltetrahydrofolate cyclo-ligase